MQLSMAQNNYMYHHHEDMDDYNDGSDVEHLRSKYKQGNTRVYHDFFKTKMCNLYLLNICKKGEDCPFAHTEDEIREKPNLHKTKLCPYFLEEGKCAKGNYCSFAHGEVELRSTPDLFKTAICNLWTQGKCSSGERCRFAHGQEDLRPAPSHHKTKKNKYNKTFHNGNNPAPRHNQNNQRYNNNNHHQNNNHGNFAYPVQPNFMPNSFAYPMYQGAEMPESFEDSDIMGAFADGNNKMHFGTFKY